MKVFIACWFDRHIDPLIEVFEYCGDATDRLEQWMEMREYSYVCTWKPSAVEHDEGEFDWIWEGPWVEYVQARIDDGPHGYVLLKEIK